jgi:pimeloyl-ACP methyl ester carboxylesterase
VVDGELFLFAAFLFKPEQKPFSEGIIVFDLEVHGGADPGKSVGKDPQQSASRDAGLRFADKDDFAADLPREQAEFMAHAQMLTAAKVFTTPITNRAWKLKPSWYLVAKDDKTINPDLERMYAERAHSRKVEVEGASHAVYVSHPKEVAALIEEAAQHAVP